MVPAKRRLIDFGECKTPALVGISDMGKVIVEIVESSVAASCSCCHLVDKVYRDEDENEGGREQCPEAGKATTGFGDRERMANGLGEGERQQSILIDGAEFC